MQEDKKSDLKDTVLISIEVDGKKIEPEVNKKFLNEDNTPNNDISIVVSRIHKEILGINRILEEKDLENFSNQCFSTDISAMMEVRQHMAERLPRLEELLGFVQDGTFSFNCTLIKCPHHSDNEGDCHCSEDLTELMKIAPDLIGCAKGRQILRMDRRKYSDATIPQRRGHIRRGTRKSD